MISTIRIPKASTICRIVIIVLFARKAYETLPFIIIPDDQRNLRLSHQIFSFLVVTYKHFFC